MITALTAGSFAQPVSASLIAWHMSSVSAWIALGRLSEICPQRRRVRISNSSVVTCRHAAAGPAHDHAHDLLVPSRIGAPEGRARSARSDSPQDSHSRRTVCSASSTILRAVVGGERLGHGGKARLVGRAGGDLGGREIEQRARRFEVGRHVGERELGVLEIGDRLAELLAFLGIADRLIEAALRAAQRAGADVEPPAVEPGHGETEAVALRADAVGDRHSHILEDHLRGGRGVPAELALRRAEADARACPSRPRGRKCLGTCPRRCGPW